MKYVYRGVNSVVYQGDDEDEEEFMNGFVEMENNAMVNAEKRKLSGSDTPNPKWQALEEAQKREERIPLMKTL